MKLRKPSSFQFSLMRLVMLVIKSRCHWYSGLLIRMGIFVKFIPGEKVVSGKAIADSIITEIRALGFDMENCWGQGHDDAGNMKGKYQGAAACIQREYELTTYVHCASHQLNLCIVSSCEILLVKKMMDHVKAAANFLIIPQVTTASQNKYLQNITE